MDSQLIPFILIAVIALPLFIIAKYQEHKSKERRKEVLKRWKEQDEELLKNIKVEITGVAKEELIEVETERCSGHCCERFLLHKDGFSYSKEQLEENLKARSSELTTEELKKNNHILDMLIPLGESKTDPNGRETKYALEYFTCRHYNKETKLCMDYENRPDFCRDHPGIGKTCDYKNCTRKTKLVPKSTMEEK